MQIPFLQLSPQAVFFFGFNLCPFLLSSSSEQGLDEMKKLLLLLLGCAVQVSFDTSDVTGESFFFY